MNFKKHFWLYIASFSACILLILNTTVIALSLINASFSENASADVDRAEVLQDLTDELFSDEDGVVLNIGRFLHAGGESEFVTKELIPQLLLNDDGTFLMNENNNRFMQTITGTYTQEENSLTLFVENSNVVISDEILFTIIDENTIVLQQDLYESKSGAEFKIN